MRFLAVVGSLRKDSYNRAVMNAAAELVGPDHELEPFDLAGIPFFNEDIEAVGDPESVAALRTALDESDGLLIFTPEYNFGVPAVTKNAVDWLSRPFGNGTIKDRPVGIVACTPGKHGAEQVRRHLSETLAVLTNARYDETHCVSSARHVVEDGRLTDEDSRAALRSWLEDFVAHAAAVGSATD